MEGTLKRKPGKGLSKSLTFTILTHLRAVVGLGNGSAGTRTEVPAVGAAGDLEITTWIAEGALVAPGRTSVVWVMHFSPHKCGAIFSPSPADCTTMIGEV